MSNTFDFAGMTFTIPRDCPDRVRFIGVVRTIFDQHFTDNDHAAECLTAWQLAMEVPPPFSADPEAASHYRRAVLALSRPARQWGAFEDRVSREFADCEEDGDSKDPAIPGWTPGWVFLCASLKVEA